MRGIATYIKREGETCDLLRDSGGVTDALNHPTESWTLVGTVRAIRYYGRRSARNRQIDTEFGNFELDQPRFAFPPTSGVQDGDRLVYDGYTYELRAILPRKSHVEATSKRIS